MQYNKRVRPTFEERAQTIPGEGFAAAPQGEVSVAVPRAACLLRCAVPGEGRHPHRAGGARPAQVLAQDVLAERSKLLPIQSSSLLVILRLLQKMLTSLTTAIVPGLDSCSGQFRTLL